MNEFEISITNYIQGNFPKGSKRWTDYIIAKSECIAIFEPSDAEYLEMIKIIADWLEL